MVKSSATVIGRTASPNENPKVAIARAFPLDATNHLAIDTEPM